LQAYNWPGNIRELQNVIERAAFSAMERRFRSTKQCARRDSGGASNTAALTEALISTEKTMIEAVLKKPEARGRSVGGGRSRLRLAVAVCDRDLVRRFVVLLDIAAEARDSLRIVVVA